MNLTNSLEQSKISDSPSSLPEDCGLLKDMSEAEPMSTKFCICCLQSEIPYIDLPTCSHSDFLDNFVMPELKPEDLVICYHCHNMLKRIKLFKQQVEESFKLLADSVENITKSNQTSRNLQKHQIFTIDIPSTFQKRKLLTNKIGIPHTKRKKVNTKIDNLKTEDRSKINTTENPQTIPEQAKKGAENSFQPNIDKKTKNIEDALKIININQNSGCIDLLASSLKTISYTLLSNIYNTNVGIGNPTDILFSNNTPTDKATSIPSDNITINNSSLAVENQLNAPTDILFSNNINTPTNVATPISNEEAIIINTTESNNTTLAIEKQNQIGRNPTDVLFSINTPSTTKTTAPSLNILTANTSDNNEITIDDNSKNNNTVENVSYEELDLSEKDESMDGGQSNMQTDEPTMKSSSINSNIRLVTLTRQQLTEERAKMASSQTFLRLPHRCESCLVGFQFRENLDDHILRKHTEDKIQNPEKCDVCLQFMEACDFDKHLLWHLTRYECVACSQQFASYDKATLHYRKYHRSAKPRALFKCPKCPFKTQLMCQLKRHIRRVSECKSCGDRIALGCGTGITFNKHTACCKGPRKGNQNELKPDQPTTELYVKKHTED